MTIDVRRATAGDEGEVLRLVIALATYEKQPDAVKATEASIRTALFGDDPRVFAHIAELDGRAVGLALWFLTYSTWTGSPSLYLEDIYVDIAVQGRGVGRELFHALGREAAALGCGRIDWRCSTGTSRRWPSTAAWARAADRLAPVAAGRRGAGAVREG